MSTNHKIEENTDQDLKDLLSKAAELEKLKADHKRVLDELRETRHELEIRVKVRTAEIAKINEELHREVAERKKIEDTLKVMGLQYINAFDSMSDPIHIVNPDLRFTLCNKALIEWNRQLGLLADNLTEKSVFEVYPFLSENVRDEYKKVFETGEVLISEENTKVGEKGFITETRKIPIIEDGKTVQVITIVRDITERKEAEGELKLMHDEIIEKNKRLEQLAVKDSHTGLYNHRYLEEIIEVEFARAKRYGNPLSAIMLDVDYFKSINDVYGHQFGDLILQQLAEQLKKRLRRYDIVVRYGGEEFVVLSPLTDKPTALSLAQRLLESINLHAFGNTKHRVKLKLSLAVASYPEDKIAKGMDLIEFADHILNKAKESGGNRVYSYSDIKDEKRLLGHKNGKEAEGVKFLKEKIEKLNKRANQSLIEAIFAFAKAIELKDKHTGRHVEMTVNYATEMAKRISLTKEEIENIREAAILHDLGKIGISENILLKKAKLTKKEFEEIKKHPQIGVDIIRPLHFLHDIIPLMLYHHERWDGCGYPHGLKGDDIPIGARIIAVADAYQALTSNRPYRKAYSKEKAVKIVMQDSGTHFDPQIVDIFLKVLRKKK